MLEGSCKFNGSWAVRKCIHSLENMGPVGLIHLPVSGVVLNLQQTETILWSGQDFTFSPDAWPEVPELVFFVLIDQICEPVWGCFQNNSVTLDTCNYQRGLWNHWGPVSAAVFMNYLLDFCYVAKRFVANHNSTLTAFLSHQWSSLIVLCMNITAWPKSASK